jgi:hypothetical protein
LTGGALVLGALVVNEALALLRPGGNKAPAARAAS